MASKSNSGEENIRSENFPFSLACSDNALSQLWIPARLFVLRDKGPFSA
jgi:hypothetical protein